MSPPPHIDDSVSESNKTLLKKKNPDEMNVRRTEKPVEVVKLVKRSKIGAGSYEDPAEAVREKKRPGKSGRPGQQAGRQLV